MDGAVVFLDSIARPFSSILALDWVVLPQEIHSAFRLIAFLCNV